jgi:hypothetical protein
VQEGGINLFKQSHLQKVNTSASFEIALQQFLRFDLNFDVDFTYYFFMLYLIFLHEISFPHLCLTWLKCYTECSSVFTSFSACHMFRWYIRNIGYCLCIVHCIDSLVQIHEICYVEGFYWNSVKVNTNIDYAYRFYLSCAIILLMLFRVTASRNRSPTS